METIKEFFSPEIIWFIIGLVLMLSEFVIPGLIIAFFGVGAWVVAVLCMLIPGISFNLQLFIFIIASVVLLLALRKQMAKVFMGFEKQKNVTADDVEDFIGHRTTVIKPISKNKKGKVEFHGTAWDAEADEDIGEGQIVEIIGRDSITLKVKSIE